MKKLLLLAFYLLHCSIQTFAQNKSSGLQFKHFGTKEGLSQTAVSEIIMDSDGFMWFCTWKGLFRYDGYAMKPYFLEVKDNRGIRSDYINTIMEDELQQLWVGTMDGLYLYNREKGFFEYIQLLQNEECKVIEVSKSSNNNLWLSTRKGLFLFNPQTKKILKKYHDGEITQVLETDTHIFVGTKEGLKILTKEGENSTNYFKQLPEDLAFGTIIDLHKDNNGMIWISSWKLYSFHPKDKTIQTHQLEVWDFYEENEELWMATTTGIHVYDFETQLLYKKENVNSEGKEIADDFFTYLYKDFQGNLWVGSFRKGVYFYNVYNSKFKLISSDQGGLEVLRHNSVMDIHQEENKLWIATDGGGISLLDIEKNEMIETPYLDRFKEQAILSIRHDKKGNEWLTTWGNGIYKIDPLTKDITTIQRQKGEHFTLPENNIWLTFEDSNGDLWVSVHEKGLCKINPETGKVLSFFIPEHQNTLFLSTFYMFEDSQRRLYFCTTQGLVVQDLNTGKIQYYNQDIAQEHPLPGYSVNCAYEDKKGRIWIGTNNGLALFDPIGGHFFKKGGDLGTLGPRVQAIQEDKEGNLWLAVNNQLVKYALTKDILSVFTPEDMAFDGEFNIGASHQLADGRILFGSTNGIILFHPEALKTNNYLAPLKIVNLELYNKEVTPTSENSPLEKVIDIADQLILDHTQEVFSLRFSTLNYAQSNQNKYMYMLEGFDKTWQDVGDKNFTTYTNLNPGKYTFRVKGSTNNGQWQEARPLKIEQLPPLWLTWWAKLIYISLFSMMIFLIYRFLIYREKLRQQIEIAQLNRQKQKDIIKIKEQFFTNISHELRTPLTLILTPLSTLLAKEKGEKESKMLGLMHNNAHRLLRLINQLMDFRKAESGLLQLHVQEGNIMQNIQELAHLYTYKAEQEKIDFQIDLQLENLWVKYDKDKLEKIIHNVLSNAFKHTKEKDGIYLHVFLAEKMEKNILLQIEVKDTGVGIAEKEQKEIFNRYYVVKENPGKGTGIGLTLTKDLVNLQNGNIHVESEIGKGANFIIQLPLEICEPKSQQESVSNEVVIERTLDIVETNSLPQNADNTTILLIDDNVEILSYLTLELEEKYHIVQAKDGKEGLEKAKSLLPDLIISDVMMPKLNGLEVCEALKGNIETSHIPLLLLTAKHSEDYQLEGYAQGADEYFTKPFNIKILQSRITYHLTLRKELRSKFKTDAFLPPKEIALSNSDQDFLDEVYKVVFQHLENTEFNTGAFCEKMGMSKTLLYNKLKVLTGCSIAEFIKSARMTTAAKLLMSEDIQIKEVAFNCGFLNQQQFYNTFTKFHGVSPTKYKEQHLKID